MMRAARRDLLEIDFLAGHEPRARFGIGEDRGERLVQLVRQRARKLAEVGDPRHVGEFQPARDDLALGRPAAAPLDDEPGDGGGLREDDSR
jgi:hypothetical protein